MRTADGWVADADFAEATSWRSLRCTAWQFRSTGESSMASRVLLPDGWAKPVGYANGIETPPGKIVFVAGQVGWNAHQEFTTAELAPQFEQALKNVLAVLGAAGGRATHICRMTAYCTDKRAYLDARPELGRIWRRLMGRHYPAMSLIFVTDLLDQPGKIELEATAVIPPPGSQ